jgi:SAM-dependent methyltransferase
MTHTFLFQHEVREHGYPKVRDTSGEGPVCPLTGSKSIQLLEEFPTTLLVDCYQRNLGIDVTPEFVGVKRLQLCRCLDSHLVFFFPAVTGSSQFYKQLQNYIWYYPAEKFEYHRAANWIQAGNRVLDIGCGAAQFARYIPHTSYQGLEVNLWSESSSLPTEQRILSENVTCYAMTNAGTYDAVCAFQVLEHLSNPRTFLTAALACLKPEGILILGVPSADSYITHIPNFVLNAPPHHVTWWTDDALYHLADRFDLSILDLAHAPVEVWETRLYWMQRIISMFSSQTSSLFTESPCSRLLNMAAYMVAKYLQIHCQPPVKAHGASMVLIARKKGR